MFLEVLSQMGGSSNWLRIASSEAVEKVVSVRIIL